ncbi:MAG: hypothetical protein COZ06_19960 [Armatimonadetes bacterium CG_4_10_14_3_um_filter_66_18]|nr:MAG: hypothetical protein COS65_19325 [Armatimonadetes bacterium CG06_land_8_20_14_3_00_66_21]PIX45615.1 MAG: hypothetical protein COZ57_14855 [Armatimonadetes bacterium CG_4_8_14_3_um_filter_66_20]PIY44698.1 MAG: hypothetical protein COZ06_19960 [Armatimonadetes bacterium CG_4_10_14_3_um_filter_66_18]
MFQVRLDAKPASHSSPMTRACAARPTTRRGTASAGRAEAFRLHPRRLRRHRPPSVGAGRQRPQRPQRPLPPPDR